jgi:hypothetical protein
VIESDIEVYQKAGFGHSRLAKWVNFVKVEGKSYSKYFKMKIKGIRKSGDNDTTSGNSKNTAFAFGSFFQMFKGYLYHLRLMVIGDDMFAAINHGFIVKHFRTCSNLILRLTAHMVTLGFKVKIEITGNLLRAEYISCKFFRQCNDTVLIGKKPGRVLSKMGWFLNKSRKVEQWIEVFKGTLISYLPTVNHVPFLRVYVEECLRRLTNVTARFTEDMKFRLMDRKTRKLVEKLTSYAQINIKKVSINWVMFEDYYGLSKHDEDQFRDWFVNNLKYGFCTLSTNPWLQVLLDKEKESEI